VLHGKYDPAVDRPRGARALERLPRQIDRAPGDRCLISDETLSDTPPERLELLREVLGDRDLRVIVTVRDIARTIPSMWQQRVRSGARQPYDRFVEGLVRRKDRGSEPLWAGQDLAGVLDRWAPLAPRDRTHVVVVPAAGAPADVLLERFCSVIDIDPAGLPPGKVDANPSLGRAQAEVLRRINALLPDDVKRRDVHRAIVKRGFAKPVLGAQEGDRILLPARLRDWCHEYAVSTIATLEQGGYAVVGDLQELVPGDDAFTDGEAPLPERQVAEAAVRALADLLTARGREWAEAKGAEGEGRAGAAG
jgi:hypothetical protein